LFAEYLGSYRLGVIHLDWVEYSDILADACNRPELGGILVVHQNRGSPSTDYGADSFYDFLGGFIEMDCPAERLADRKDQLDFLITGCQRLGQPQAVALATQKSWQDGL
jgi:hypothetical protein